MMIVGSGPQLHVNIRTLFQSRLWTSGRSEETLGNQSASSIRYILDIGFFSIGIYKLDFAKKDISRCKEQN